MGNPHAKYAWKKYIKLKLSPRLHHKHQEAKRLQMDIQQICKLIGILPFTEDASKLLQSQLASKLMSIHRETHCPICDYTYKNDKVIGICPDKTPGGSDSNYASQEEFETQMEFFRAQGYVDIEFEDENVHDAYCLAHPRERGFQDFYWETALYKETPCGHHMCPNCVMWLCDEYKKKELFVCKLCTCDNQGVEPIKSCTHP